MAEPTPGQVITPGGDKHDSSAPSTPPRQEVSVDLSQSHASQQVQPAPVSSLQAEVVSQPAPVSVSPVQQAQPLAPQQPIAPQPAPTPTPQPATSQVSQTGGFVPQLQARLAPEIEPAQPQYEPADAGDAIAWTASEYITHQKSMAWYGALTGGTLLFATVVYFLTGGDIVSVVVIVIAAIIFGIYAGKTPKEQQYSVSSAGIMIGSKVYGFDQLKTFSITDEGAFSSITFWPLKRFMPAISVYYDPQDEEKIVEVIANYLPLDTERRDPIDSLMRKIRF